MEPVRWEHGPDHDLETSTTTLADPSNNTTFQSTDWNKVKPSRSASTNKLETPLPPSSWWTSPLMKDTAQPPLTIAPTAATSSTCKTQSTTANLSTQPLACASPTAGQTSQMTTALTFHPHGRVKSSKRVFICCNVTSCGYNLTIIKNKSGSTFNIPYVWQKCKKKLSAENTLPCGWMYVNMFHILQLHPTTIYPLLTSAWWTFWWNEAVHLDSKKMHQ